MTYQQRNTQPKILSSSFKSKFNIDRSGRIVPKHLCATSRRVIIASSNFNESMNENDFMKQIMRAISSDDRRSSGEPVKGGFTPRNVSNFELKYKQGALTND